MSWCCETLCCRGDSLIYTVKVLQGEMPPPKAADVSVFVDIIGMPLTPVSYAGVVRRSYRRASIIDDRWRATGGAAGGVGGACRPLGVMVRRGNAHSASLPNCSA